MDISYNALWTTDGPLQAFLASEAPGWDQTQTIAPGDLASSLPTSSSVLLDWAPIAYTGDTGRYAVFVDPAPPSGAIFADGFESGDADWWGLGNPWVTTTDKTESSILVQGLAPGKAYDFLIRTVTDSHGSNANQVISDPSAVITDTTTP